MPYENNFKKTSKTFFDKKDFLKIGGAVILTLLVASLFNIFSPKIPASLTSHSAPISEKELYDYNQAYNNLNPLLIKYVEKEGSTDYKYGNLQGFRISAKNLYAIIRKNMSEDENGNRKFPDEVMFYLGQQGTFDYNGKTYGNINIIAVGVKNSVLLIPSDPAERTNSSKSSIYDKADPCPGPGCPLPPPAN